MNDAHCVACEPEPPKEERIDEEYIPNPNPVTEIMAAPVDGTLVLLQAVIVEECIEARTGNAGSFTR